MTNKSSFDLDFGYGRKGEQLVDELLTGGRTVEVKRDRKWAKTNNLYIETECFFKKIEDWAPSGLKGFYRWFGDSTKTITNKALTSNIATLTTGSAHGFEVGQSVTVSTVDSTFNGTYTITAVPTTTTFRYAKTATDVASTAVSPAGSVIRNRGYLAVTDFSSQGSTSSYNVPGNEDYNADLPVDFIIASTEDPTA
jgi:hypothetical protein